MLRRLVIILGLYSLTQFVACGGGDDSGPPPQPPPSATCPGTTGGTVSVQTKDSNFNLATGPGGVSLSANSPDGSLNVNGTRPCPPPVDPQSLTDLQSAFYRAKATCCETYGQMAALTLAAYPNPEFAMPPVNLVSCNDAVTQAILLGKTVYGPWGGDAYPPYHQYMMNQGKALLSCIGATAGITSPTDPRVSYLVVKATPVIQTASVGSASYAYSMFLPYVR